MANSLLIGVSGLTSHQRMIEVVGHNLANINTTGYKTRRAAFADHFYDNIKTGAAGTPGTIGGTNPAQIGNGSQLSSIGVNFSQGGLDPTGSKFDFAISGEGFFVVNSDAGQQFTRAGVFSIDQSGFLVDSATGKYVQRFGTVGEVSTFGPAFQTNGSPNIRIPIGATVPGSQTQAVNLRGNLSPSSVSDTRQTLSSVTGLTAGGNVASGTTLLNDLDSTTAAFQAGDSIQVDGTGHGGEAFDFGVPVDATSTIQTLVDGINANLQDATASFGADGRLQIESNETGASFLSLVLSNPIGNSGQADFSGNPLQTSISGAEGDVVNGGMEVFDEQGAAHVVGIDLKRQTDGSWNLEAKLDPSEGTMSDNVIENIRFNPDGSFQSAGGAGIGDSSLVFDFHGASGPQTVEVDFGEAGTLTSITSFAVASSVVSDQDGYSTGTLIDVNIGESGVVEGIASNGRRFPLAQLAVGTFTNVNGLEKVGENFFRPSAISGSVELGAARTGGRGAIQAGQLEQSNVDIAVEFTRLIVAQRGFSANAKTITVTSEILEELTDLVR